MLLNWFDFIDEYDYTEGGEHDPSNASGAQANGFHPSWGNYGKDSNGECSVPMKHRWKSKLNYRMH
jgi:hypothetical protein